MLALSYQLAGLARTVLSQAAAGAGRRGRWAACGPRQLIMIIGKTLLMSTQQDPVHENL